MGVLGRPSGRAAPAEQDRPCHAAAAAQHRRGALCKVGEREQNTPLFDINGIRLIRVDTPGYVILKSTLPHGKTCGRHDYVWRRL